MKPISNQMNTDPPKSTSYFQRLAKLDEMPPEAASASDVTSVRSFVSSNLAVVKYGTKLVLAPIIALFK